MNKPITFTQEYRIDTTMINFNQQLSLEMLLGLLEDTATEHASILGLDYNSMLEKGFFWVLIQQRLRLWQNPMWNETITLKTWVTKMTGIYATREYELFLGGKKIGECSLTCMILDSKTHRPKRMNKKTDQRLTHEIPQLDFKAEKIRLPDNLQKVRSLSVNISDLDMNNHVNNVRYTRWVLDTLSMDYHRNYSIVDYQINFSGETFLNDKIDCFCHIESEQIPLENCTERPFKTLYFSGVRQNDGKTVFTVKADLQPNETNTEK